MKGGVPHELEFAREYGRSPGNGMTEMPMSRDPLATEGEATPGPDDVNPYEERERKAEMARFDASLDEDPTAGDDPFVFDDIGGTLPDLSLPSMAEGPILGFMDGGGNE